MEVMSNCDLDLALGLPIQTQLQNSRRTKLQIDENVIYTSTSNGEQAQGPVLHSISPETPIRLKTAVEELNERTSSLVTRIQRLPPGPIYHQALEDSAQINLSVKELLNKVECATMKIDCQSEGSGLFLQAPYQPAIHNTHHDSYPSASVQQAGPQELRACPNRYCATKKHARPLRSKTVNLARVITGCTNQATMDCQWVVIGGHRRTMLTGRQLRNEILGTAELINDVCEAIIVVFRMLELDTLRENPHFVPRHFLGPAWGDAVASGEASGIASLELFTATRCAYPINMATMVLVLLHVKKSWVCYAIDFPKRILTILDPEITSVSMHPNMEFHQETSHRILSEAVLCMREVCKDPTFGLGHWETRLLTSSQRHVAANTGIVALNCMRWFNGPNVCCPTNDQSRIVESRREFAYMLVRTEANIACAAMEVKIRTIANQMGIDSTSLFE
ncbi:hypothetical protein ACP4OV_029242 [Aristida adscensionis]